MAIRKRTNNYLQNISHKTKDRVTRTPLKYILLITIQRNSMIFNRINFIFLFLSMFKGKRHGLNKFA